MTILKDSIPNYVARAAEVGSGLTLPILCFTCMPAYRKFCNEPDPDDLKLSKPKGKIKQVKGQQLASFYLIKEGFFLKKDIM